MMKPVVYSGVDSHGVPTGGALSPDHDVAEFVARKFKTGWRSLIMRRDGIDIAGINRIGRNRSWWAES